MGIEYAIRVLFSKEQWRPMVLMLALFFSYIYVVMSSMDGKGNAMRGQPTTNLFCTKVACLLPFVEGDLRLHVMLPKC